MKTEAEVQSNEPRNHNSQQSWTCFETKLRPEGPKKNFFRTPPLISGSGFPPPPSSEGLNPPLIWFTFGRLKGHESFFSQWRGVQIKKTGYRKWSFFRRSKGKTPTIDLESSYQRLVAADAKRRKKVSATHPPKITGVRIELFSSLQAITTNNTIIVWLFYNNANAQISIFTSFWRIYWLSWLSVICFKLFYFFVLLPTVFIFLNFLLSLIFWSNKPF